MTSREQPIEDRVGDGRVADPRMPMLACLHLEVDLRVDVRRRDRDVTQPGPNRVDVGAST